MFYSLMSFVLFILFAIGDYFQVRTPVIPHYLLFFNVIIGGKKNKKQTQKQ